jgi:hypothetical protein
MMFLVFRSCMTLEFLRLEISILLIIFQSFEIGVST